MPAKIESYANQTNDVKNSVRAATVENITLSGLIVLDGISLSENDRVLVKNQTISSNNGVYTVKSGSWTRSNDANSSSKVSSGMLVLVEEGSLNADTAWLLATNDPITLDTSPLSFIKFSTGGLASTYSVLIGNGFQPTFTVTHNLNTVNDAYVVVRDTISSYYVYPDIVYLDANSIQVQFASAPTSNQYRVTVIGI
jgi:hypothetical protein